MVATDIVRCSSRNASTSASVILIWSRRDIGYSLPRWHDVVDVAADVHHGDVV